MRSQDEEDIVDYTSERKGARRSVESESEMKVKEVKDMKNVVSWISQLKRYTNL